jgi:hypothetical protein
MRGFAPGCGSFENLSGSNVPQRAYSLPRRLVVEIAFERLRKKRV